MRPVTLLEFALSTNAWGGGTVTSVAPVSGEVLSVRAANAAVALMGTAGTAALTVTRVADGGTILSSASQGAPFDLNPRLAAHTVAAGTSAYGLGVGPVLSGGVPVDGYVRVVVAGGSLSSAGTLHVYVKGV